MKIALTFTFFSYFADLLASQQRVFRLYAQVHPQGSDLLIKTGMTI